jgi:hypothetical protein
MRHAVQFVDLGERFFSLRLAARQPRTGSDKLEDHVTLRSDLKITCQPSSCRCHSAACVYACVPCASILGEFWSHFGSILRACVCVCV